MSTLKMLDNYIKEQTGTKGPYPDIIQKGVNTIAGEVPFKLKLAITLSELITFTSHIRKHIKLYDGTLVPTNAIVFALSASGTSKDRSLNTIRASLQGGYDYIEEARKEYAREKAEQIALLEGETAQDWQKYYKAPKPLQAGLGTVEGLIHHFADLSQNPIGAGSLLTSEIGAELQANGAMGDIIKVVSVAYDLGNIPAKIIKSHENQTETIKNLPVNALFFGSQEALLFNNEIKSKFKLVFNTQLARRSIFTFTPEPPTTLDITSVDELYELREKERERVLKAQNALKLEIDDLIQRASQDPITLTDEAQKLFDVYMEYNNILSNEMPNKHPISKLSRKHKQWLALKLAGSYAILGNSEVVDEEIYAYAINTVELLASDLTEFEKELVKEPYEQLVDMCKFSAEDKSYFVSLHDLRKLSYVTGASSKSKVEELCVLANSYDKTGQYAPRDGGIEYKEVVKTDVIGVSYKIFDTALTGDALKNYMKRNSAEDYEFYETDFEELELLLQENAAYCSFAFQDGKRGKEYLEGGTKFIVLDVDKSMLTDEEAHELLHEYNHYIVRTSDPENAFRFRVILELDSYIEIDDQTWKAFLQEIGDELGLIVDLLPRSQIFLSFAHRTILKQVSGKTLQTKFLLEKASQRIREKPKPANALPSREKQLKLADPRETFGYAFNAEQGERSIMIYRALAHAIDLGADAEYVEHLAHEINKFLVVPMEHHRLESTLIKPALRRIG
jgi:hypothetical protein